MWLKMRQMLELFFSFIQWLFIFPSLVARSNITECHFVRGCLTRNGVNVINTM